MPAIRQERSGVMLAHPVSDRRLRQISVEDKVFTQPKYNGERCRTVWFQGEPFLLSSYGNEFRFCKRLKNQILKKTEELGIEEIAFDGEIYVHGWSREEIDSALRRTKNYNPKVEELEYHIFDIQDKTMLQYNRFVSLKNLQSKGFFEQGLHFVVPEAIEIQEWQDKAVSYVAQGYEGIILRSPVGEYVDRRTNNLLKFKPTEEDEYTIVDLLEGQGWCTGMLGAFLVQGNDGVSFEVGSGRELTKKNRIDYWKHRTELIGRVLTVKHEPIKTSGGKPVCAVAYKLK